MKGKIDDRPFFPIRATKGGSDTTLGKVIQLVTEAEAHKPESVALIDRYAQWFTPAILLSAGVVWLLTQQVDRAVTVLIVGCPCALILAAPTAIVAAISRAAKNGIMIKGAQLPFLLRLGKKTVGIVVAGASIIHLEILSANGPYGAAVSNEAFNRQFCGASLKGDDLLDQNIDAVSGATVSSNAVSRMARLSLILDSLKDSY